MFPNSLRVILKRAGGASSLSKKSQCFSVSAFRGKHTLPDLPYDYSALEPAISGQIMEIHHSKHHATYVNNLNAVEEQLSSKQGDVSGQISLQAAHKFNGGGHINHSIFWTNLCPTSEGGGHLGEGALKAAIEKEFGSIDAFKTKFNTQAAGVQGSGWAWLALNPLNKGLSIATCANQDPLQATTGLIPLLGVDVWEHAYYLQYKNVRPDYLKAVWEVVNWKNVEERYAQGLQ